MHFEVWLWWKGVLLAMGRRVGGAVVDMIVGLKEWRRLKTLISCDAVFVSEWQEFSLARISTNVFFLLRSGDSVWSMLQQSQASEFVMQTVQLRHHSKTTGSTIILY